MKIDKLNLDGKKASIEVLDKIFSAKINKRLLSKIFGTFLIIVSIRSFIEYLSIS